MGIIVVSLADSICRHPDVTLESGLVPHTYVDLSSRYRKNNYYPQNDQHIIPVNPGKHIWK